MFINNSKNEQKHSPDRASLAQVGRPTSCSREVSFSHFPTCELLSVVVLPVTICSNIQNMCFFFKKLIKNEPFQKVL